MDECVIMDRNKTRIAALVLALMLGGCAGGEGVAATKPIQTPDQSPPANRPIIIPPREEQQTPTGVRTPFRKPQLMVLPGAEGVLGASAAQIKGQFGTPRLEVTEGDVRKLQFQGPACVLDIYLYPMTPGGEARATYIDARRASDGLDVDRIACINALKGG